MKVEERVLELVKIEYPSSSVEKNTALSLLCLSGDSWGQNDLTEIIVGLESEFHIGISFSEEAELMRKSTVYNLIDLVQERVNEREDWYRNRS